jgi:hypothetical protein
LINISLYEENSSNNNLNNCINDQIKKAAMDTKREQREGKRKRKKGHAFSERERERV